MRFAFSIVLLLVLSSCEQVEWAKQAEPVMSEQDMREFIAARPGYKKACLDKLRYGGLDALPHNDSECVEFMPKRRWKGIWNAGWEWSNFCPAPAKTCGVTHVEDEIDLQFAKDVLPDAGFVDGTYEVEFEGRRTKVAGHFGHLGQYPHIIVVDRMISLRRIAEPPDWAR